MAIDGSNFKAVNNRDKNFTKAEVERRALSGAVDRRAPSEAIELKKTHLKEKLTKLKSEMAKLHAMEKQVLAVPDQQTIW